MAAYSIQPDLVLTLDYSGVIHSAKFSGDLASAELSTDTAANELIGQTWRDTCDAANAGKVDRIIQGALKDEICGFSQINQRLPDGQTLLFEFVAVQTQQQQQRIVVVGKNLSAVVNLQNKLLSTQRSMEKEFWKLREMETRYSTLVNANSDVVLVLRDPDLQVVDINEHASRLIGVAVGDRATDLDMSEKDFKKLLKTIDTARQSGRAPLIVLKNGASNYSWRVRVSSYTGQSGIQFMLQFSIHDTMVNASNVEPISGITFNDIVTHLPEGLVAINQQNLITHANPAFGRLLDRTTATASDTTSIVGKPIDQWLPESSKDVEILRAKLMETTPVLDYSTCLLSTDDKGLVFSKEVLISAQRVSEDSSELMLMLVRAAA